jgi:hypothetical protein
VKTATAVHGWTIPGWATPHNLALIAAATGAGLVIIMLARAVGRLASLARIAAAPVAAAKPSRGGAKLLLLAGAAGAGIWAYVKTRHPAAATAVRAAPAPSPSPLPTVTRTVAPHVTPHFAFPVHLTGGEFVIIILIAAVVVIVLLGPAVRRPS